MSVSCSQITTSSELNGANLGLPLGFKEPIGAAVARHRWGVDCFNEACMHSDFGDGFEPKIGVDCA